VPDSASHPAATLDRIEARSWAIEAGFADAALVPLPHPQQERDAARFDNWLRAGRAATMHYLARTDENGWLVRSRVEIPFPWARSAILCFSSYHAAEPRSTDPAPPDSGWIARYAWSSRQDAAGARRPSDYHKVLLKRLKALEARLRQQFIPFKARAYVDTGPVVERALATAAGLGWTGKNTCLIHPKLGSYGFLAVLVTSLPVQNEDTLKISDRCGSCRRCLDACPTGALFAPYQMDASLCISYLTIEHRGPIPASLMQGMGRQIFGCDICQDVCPWNRKSPIAADPELEPRAELVNPSLDWLAGLDEPAFERQFNGSPVRRAGFLGLRRNLAIAMGNSGLARFSPLLEEWAASADEGMRAAARWALEKVAPGKSGS
jgi:epoxyqueuosine reductase